MQDYEKGLDLHGRAIMGEFRSLVPVYQRQKKLVPEFISRSLEEAHVLVTAIESRIKTGESLAGKLALKGSKYASVRDITDIVGARVITFYSDDVDKIAALIQKTFDVDWENSVDKRRQHSLESFGYMSLHYVCRIPAELYSEPEFPELNEIRFEIQMRTALQHVWANMYHDTGYKSGLEVPPEHLRMLNRLAGVLELADDEFSRVRTSINDYRRKVQTLVSDGNFDEVSLSGDSFKSYLALNPFGALTARIAAINQAEVQEVPLVSYLSALRLLGCETIGDVERLRTEYSEKAYRMSVHQIGQTDLDIISSGLALQNLCIVCTVSRGGGTLELEKLFEAIDGPSPYNAARARSTLAFIEKIRK
ncbi:MAG: hypothetical protein IJS62_02555 [Bacteroidales bacterium]|nr:hypothetical protein [Bacteroidales bacterium]